MTSPLHSIRWRVQLWHALILLLALGTLCSAVYHLQSENDLRRIDRELNARERELIFSLGAITEGHPASPAEVFARLSNGEAQLPPPVAAAFAGNAAGFTYFSFRDRGRVMLQSANAPANLLFLPVPEAGMVEETRSVGHRRELSRSADFGLQMVFGRDISPELEQQHRFAFSLAAAGLTVWLVSLGGGLWFSGRALRPIQAISQTATRIAAGNLDERISIEKDAGELRELGGVLNRTFDRLRHMLELQRQFTADAAHELRTPVTVLTAEIQRILKRERSPEEYRAAFAVCAESTARMRRLVEDLLLLARQESSPAPSGTCDLAALTQEALRSLAVLAGEKELRIHPDLQPARCVSDATALSTVIANVVGNAIQHHDRAGGRIEVFTREEGPSAFLVVRDNGPGIAPEDLPHIFDRFYRADKSRAVTGTGHTGLGLAIVKTIVESHGGKIECSSTPGHGATFTVTLPVAPGSMVPASQRGGVEAPC